MRVSWRIALVTAAAMLCASAAQATQAPPNPPSAGFFYETPASLSCVYQLVTPMNGCDPNKALNPNLALGGQTIAFVVTYHSNTLAADLQSYATQFALPTPNLSVVKANGSTNAATCTTGSTKGGDDAAGLSCHQFVTDLVETAHALAPLANLVVVEMASSSTADFAQAVDVATQQVVNAGGGEVVLAVEYTEASALTALETHFTGTSNVLYFAPTGYFGSVTYPGSSPNVISVGSSSIARATANPSNLGQFRYEASSAAGGSGFSTLFPAPAFQAALAPRLGFVNKRAVPDVAMTNNNNANLWVYNGGTWYPASGPFIPVAMAAAVANAGHATQYHATTAAELQAMYAQIGTASFFDVATGDCGEYDGDFVTAAGTDPTLQYDLCSGLGTPRGVTGFGH